MQRTERRKRSSIAFEDCRILLISAIGSWMDVCNQTLLERTGKEWILVVEALDKTGISPQQLQELFIQYGTVFQDLRVNMIFTIPVWLAYSPEANRLPFERHMIHDTPVYDQKHGVHENGRGAVQAVLEARVSPRWRSRWRRSTSSRMSRRPAEGPRRQSSRHDCHCRRT
jgi:hypothetical protein